MGLVCFNAFGFVSLLSFGCFSHLNFPLCDLIGMLYLDLFRSQNSVLVKETLKGIILAEYLIRAFFLSYSLLSLLSKYLLSLVDLLI